MNILYIFSKNFKKSIISNLSRVKFQNPAVNGKKKVFAANSLNLLTEIVRIDSTNGLRENLRTLSLSVSFKVLMVVRLILLISWDKASVIEFSFLSSMFLIR